MKEEAYLIIGPRGITGLRKTKPTLRWNEISLKLYLDIPDAMFRRPHVEAIVKVNEEAIKTQKISPEILIHTQKLIERESGMKVDFRIIHQEKEKKKE